MAKVIPTSRSKDDIKNKWYSMKRKEDRLAKQSSSSNPHQLDSSSASSHPPVSTTNATATSSTASSSSADIDTTMITQTESV
jgi:hypothetical protein